MNFQLKLASKKKKKKVTRNARPPKSVFGGDGDDSDGNDNNQQGDARSSVNRAIKKEQEAMRKRAEQSMKQVEAQQQGASIYDYDGTYDSMHDKQKEDKKQPAVEKKSRYIGDLLKAAKERNYDRDIAYERKMKREIESEEQVNEDLQGKDRFVTASYKAKLQERKLWQEKQDALEKKDGEAQSSGNGGMANFYGNFNKNVAMGAVSSSEIAAAEKQPRNHDMPLFLDGFERSCEPNDESKRVPSKASPVLHEKEKNPEMKRQQSRKLREEKVAQARKRYFKRQEGMTQQITSVR